MHIFCLILFYLKTGGLLCYNLLFSKHVINTTVVTVCLLYVVWYDPSDCYYTPVHITDRASSSLRLIKRNVSDNDKYIKYKGNTRFKTPLCSQALPKGKYPKIPNVNLGKCL